MFSKIVLVVALFALFQQANTLSCNLCLGSETGDCAQSGNYSIVNHCIAADGLTYMGKTFGPDDIIEKHCVSYLMTENIEVGSGVLRGCGYILKGQDICEYLEVNGYGTKCTSCEEDFCNTEPVV